MPSPPQRPSPREKKTVDVSTASEGCPARRLASPVVLALKILYPHPSKPTDEQRHLRRAAVFDSVPRIRAPTPTAIRDMFSGSGFNPKTDIAGIISQSMGTRVLNSATRTFLWQNGRPAPGDHLLRAAPFGRIAFANTDLSGVADHRSSITEAKCGRTVARSGSELNLFVFIVLVFFDLDP